MSRKVKSTAHWEELMAKLLSDTTHKKYTDVDVEVGGEIFHCHKLILALKSPYFEQLLFSSSPPPSSSSSSAAAVNQTIILNDVRSDAFDKILQFMYTGETELSDQNVENILKAADLVKLTELTTFCADYLTDTLSPDTYPRYWKLAEQMNLATLALACRRLCLKEFGKIVSSSDDLSSLSVKMMMELLGEDELVVESEVDVCEVLMRWLNSQTHSGNTVQPQQLLTLIRWSGVPVEYVKTKLITNSILMGDRPSFEFLSKVVSYRLTGVQFEGLNTFHRASTGVEQCVVIVGLDIGSTITPDVYLLSLQRKDLVTGTQAIPTTPKFETTACVSGKELYITGVGTDKNETWKWESAFGWTRCADMIEGRRRHCAAFVNNTSLFVLGGFVNEDEKTLDSIEQYSTVTNKWTKVGQLIHATRLAAYAVYKTSIYVFGGSGQNDVYLDCVQVFDTATKQCTELTQRLPTPESLLRAVMWDKSVILINRRTCLIFDLEQQTFQRRDQFAAGIIYFGLALENERIFIIGGGYRNADSGREPGPGERSQEEKADSTDNSDEDECDDIWPWGSDEDVVEATWTCSDEVNSVAEIGRAHV